MSPERLTNDRRFRARSRGELSDIVAYSLRSDPDHTAAIHELAASYDLTSREQNVLACLMRNLTTTETARDLNISEKTVKTHVKSIYSKLGVHSKQGVIDLIRDGKPTSTSTLNPQN